MNVSILIPAYNPDPNLAELIAALINKGVRNIIVVNDGSKPECGPVFMELEEIKGCHVLHHAVNLGKGRALKTGLNYYFLRFPDSPGVVTADADGQHKTEDILKVSSTLEDNADKLILGARRFNKNIPLRSLIGNMLTKAIFFFLIGKKISDTQTGLRGIPKKYVPLFIKLEGEGYEYETNMLIATKLHHISVIEEQISTVYIDNNKSSHFNPFMDSMKIYFLLFRFAFSSILASLIDFIVFTICYKLTSNIFTSIFIGRFTVGPLINFSVNKSFVFHHRGSFGNALVKYYSFATIMGIIASTLIQITADKFSLSVILSKILVESFLFMISFTIQRDYIFVNKLANNLLPKNKLN